MDDQSAAELVWLDRLATEGSRLDWNGLGGTDVLATAREVLPETVVRWAMNAAAQVADEVEELRRVEAIPQRDGTGRLERMACAAGVLTTLISLRTGVPVDGAPAEMLRQVRASFRQGADLPAVIRFVWAHHFRFQERLLVAQRKLVSPGEDAGQLQDLHTRMHLILDTYISAIDSEFRHEQSQWEGGSPARRREVLEAVLEGEEAPAQSERDLGVRLTASYVFVFITATGGVLDDEFRGQLHSLRDTIGQRQGAVDGFAQDFGESGLWWCFTFPVGRNGSAGDELRSLRFPDGLRVGVGSLKHGPDELASAIQSAVMAHRVADHPARRQDRQGRQGRGEATDIVLHDDARLLTLLQPDEGRLGEFVRETLGELARDTEKNAEIRRTLLVYLLHSRSRKVAGEILHISPNTVAYRVAQAHELAGQEELGASLDVLMALYVLDLLPGIVGSAATE